MYNRVCQVQSCNTKNDWPYGRGGRSLLRLELEESVHVTRATIEVELMAEISSDLRGLLTHIRPNAIHFSNLFCRIYWDCSLRYTFTFSL